MVTNAQTTLEVLLPSTLLFAGVLSFLLFRHSAYKRSVNSLLQGCLDGVLVVDMQRSVLFYNDAFAALWRPPSDLLASRDDRRLLAHATAQLVDPDAYVAGVENAFISEEARWNDLAVLKDGRIFERRSQPFWQNGVIKGRFFSFRDVTDRCRTEEALRADMRRHQTFSRMALFAADSPDLRTFFKAVQGDICDSVSADAATLEASQGAKSSGRRESNGSQPQPSRAIWTSREFAGQLLTVIREGKGSFSPHEITFLTNTVRLLESCAARPTAKNDRSQIEESCLAVEMAGTQARRPNEAEAVSREQRAKLQLLVVEDNPINQKVLVQMLKRSDHTVDVACDGAEAVEMAARTTYDLILMDCQMPRMDGFDATRAIRAEGLNRRTNIVAVTANAFPEDRTRCLDAGMNDHVPKPLTKARLDETLSRWLHG